MPPWEDPELPDDEDEITQRILAGMAETLEGWEPHEGAPEVALAEEMGRETAVVHARAVAALQLAIAGIGETYFKLQPRLDAVAVLPDVKLSMLLPPEAGIDAGGDTFDRAISISAGFAVLHDEVAFVLLEDIAETVTFTRITSGFTTNWYAGALHVAMTATVPGTIGNIPAGSALTITTSTGLISSATVLADGAGGVDGEALADYLNRLTDYLSNLRPGGARAEDMAALARTVSGVYRAMGIDLYDPAEADPQERTATVVAIDAAGAPIVGSELTDLQATLERAREVNFQVITTDPTYTPLDVAATVHAAAGVDHTDLGAAVSAAIAALISPGTWGSSPVEPRAWVERTTISGLDVGVAAAQVAGVASVAAATVNGSAGITTLDGPAALPAALDAVDPSTITVTVT